MNIQFSNIVEKIEYKEIVVKELFERKKPVISEELPDDGKGKKTVWIVYSTGKVEYPSDMYGQFFSGNSFIILYTYRKPMSANDSHIIYYWQGRNAKLKEKGTAAVLTVNLDKDLEAQAEEVCDVVLLYLQI